MTGLRQFAIARYAFYSFIALEIVALPTLLNGLAYGELEYLRSVAIQASALLLGSHTGYLFFRFTRDESPFVELKQGALVTLTIGGVLAAFALGTPWIVPAFVAVGLAAVVEKRLQAEKSFLLAILYRPLSSVVLLGAVALGVYLPVQLFARPAVLVNVAYVGAMALWLWLVSRHDIASFVDVRRWSWTDDTLRKYVALIRSGIVENLATVMFGLFLFVDRYFIRRYSPVELPAYSLAFNLAQFVIVGLNSIAYVSAISLGEQRKSLEWSAVKGRLRRTLEIFAGLFAVTVVAAVAYDRWVNPTNGLVSAVVLIAAFNGLFFSVNTLASIVLYEGQQWRSTIAVGVALVVNGVGAAVMAHASASWLLLLLKSGVILLCLSAFNVGLIRAVMRNAARDRSRAPTT